MGTLAPRPDARLLIMADEDMSWWFQWQQQPQRDAITTKACLRDTLEKPIIIKGSTRFLSSPAHPHLCHGPFFAESRETSTFQPFARGN